MRDPEEYCKRAPVGVTRRVVLVESDLETLRFCKLPVAETPNYASPLTRMKSNRLSSSLSFADEPRPTSPSSHPARQTVKYSLEKVRYLVCSVVRVGACIVKEKPYKGDTLIRI